LYQKETKYSLQTILCIIKAVQIIVTGASIVHTYTHDPCKYEQGGVVEIQQINKRGIGI